MFSKNIQLPKNTRLVTWIVMTSKKDAKKGWDELVEAWFTAKWNWVFEKDNVWFEIWYDPKLKKMYVEYKIEEIENKK